MTVPVPIERMLLSARTYNALLRNGIETVEQLAAVPDPEEIPGIRSKGAAEIRRALKQFPTSA